MKTIKKIGLVASLSMLPSFFTQASAQSHNIRSLGCKYYKEAPNPGSGARVNGYEECQPCLDKINKELKAKQAENNRRDEILAAKLKAEADKLEKERREQLAAEEAEKIRKAESIARTKKEADEAISRSSEIRSRFKQLNNIKGEEYEEEISGLEAYNDKDFFGVKLNGDFLWRKTTDNLPIQMQKIIGTNYFIAYNGSKGKVYNLYGKPILIDGEEWIDEIVFDKDNNIFKVKVLEEQYTLASSNELDFAWINEHEVDFYKTKADLLTVHNALIDAALAAHKKRYAGTTGAILSLGKRDLHAAGGLSIKADLKFNVLEKNRGYFFKY